MTGELEAIVDGMEVHGEGGDDVGCDLGYEAGQLVGGDGIASCGGEPLEGGSRLHLVDPGGAGGGGEVDTVGRRGRMAADGDETGVVEHDVGEVPGRLVGQGRQPAEIHEQRAVAVEYDDPTLRLGQGDAEGDRGCQAHGVLEVEERWPMPEAVQLGGHRT